MRAKTRLQHKVVTANGRLLPQTKKQELWAFRQCISHYAYRTKNGETTCMDCGYQWNESNKRCAVAHIAVQDWKYWTPSAGHLRTKRIIPHLPHRTVYRYSVYFL